MATYVLKTVGEWKQSNGNQVFLSEKFKSWPVQL